MAQVRTKTIALRVALVVGTPEALYTCPTGKTAVIKWWRVSNASGSSQTLSIAIRRSGTRYIFWRSPGLANDSAVGDTDSYIVLEPGDELVTFIPGAAGSVAVHAVFCGVELAGVAP